MNTTSFFIIAILATILYALTVVMFFVLHLVKSPYKITTHALSDYAIGTTAKQFQLYAWFGTTGALTLTFLFYFSQKPIFPSFVAVCMLIMIVARIGVSMFDTDLEESAVTRTGLLHYLFAILTFAFAYTAIANATPVFIANSISFSSILQILQYIALISLIGVVVTMFKPLRRFFAIIERSFLLSTLLWFLLASFLFIG